MAIAVLLVGRTVGARVKLCFWSKSAIMSYIKGHQSTISGHALNLLLHIIDPFALLLFLGEERWVTGELVSNRPSKPNTIVIFSDKRVVTMLVDPLGVISGTKMGHGMLEVLAAAGGRLRGATRWFSCEVQLPQSNVSPTATGRSCATFGNSNPMPCLIICVQGRSITPRYMMEMFSGI